MSLYDSVMFPSDRQLFAGAAQDHELALSDGGEPGNVHTPGAATRRFGRGGDPGSVQRQNFSLVYQPVVRADGTLWGAESLVRWEHPQYGIQPLERMVPLVGTPAVAQEVGAWSLATACAQAAAWQRRFGPLHINVNVTLGHLASSSLVDDVVCALEEADLPADRLSLEICEGSMVVLDDAGQERLRLLRNLGVGLFLDNVGSGLLSVGIMKRVPITGMKIDRALTKDIALHSRARAVMRWLNGIARDQALDVIADGVDTTAELQAVLLQGIGKLQGSLYSTGLLPSQFESRFCETDPSH